MKGTITKGQQSLKKTPGPEKRKADELAMNRFLDNFDNTEEDYDYDPIKDLRLQFKQLGINQAKIAWVIHVVLKLSQYKCSNYGRTGHNSYNCPKNKKRSKSRYSNKSKSKKKGRVNLATKDSDSESSTSSSNNDSLDNNSDSEETSSESEADINVNITHLKKSKE